MNAAVENSPAGVSDRWGRRLTCVACGRKLSHPEHGGRPRVICGRHQCELAWRRLKRKAESPPPPWTEADVPEARRVWRGRCAYCDQLSTGALVVFSMAPLPVCIEHEAFGPLIGTTPERCRRAQRWLSNCKPGCPLPNPWAGGGE